MMKLRIKPTCTRRQFAWLASATSIGAALWGACALAEEPLGSSPGDESLTCEQIYAHGMAESQREQRLRDERNEQLRRESAGMAALGAAAMAAGGLGGTGIAAQRAAEGMADKQMSMLGTPQKTNPRLDHLKRLWTQKNCVKK